MKMKIIEMNQEKSAHLKLFYSLDAFLICTLG